jgi:SAM-dependent methyltransferase/GNAT superfamily N-acetyltransferase
MQQPRFSFVNSGDLDFIWTPGRSLSIEVLNECSALYSNHYGKWSPSGKRPGENIKLSSIKLQDLLNNDYSWAVLARYKEKLIAYAFSLRLEFDGNILTWITQLVVHSSYRNQGVATYLLMNLWSFSNHYAWGLLTPSPYAVRALEKATRRRCDPNIIKMEADKLLVVGKPYLPYFPKKTKPNVSSVKSVINTEFYISHEGVAKMLRNVSHEKKWLLGNLVRGEEWFAFTFRSQEEFPLTPEELESMLSFVDSIAKRAYEGMNLDSKHLWMRYTDEEVDFIVDKLNLRAGNSILDFGCGNGRHAIELARRGYFSTGVDFSKSLISIALNNSKGINNANFFHDDCRTIKLPRQYDAAICVYDVIGTFPNQEENIKILKNLNKYVVDSGRIILSVLNFTPTWKAAIHKYDIFENPERLLELPPSNIMETTGQIFDPKYYIVDTRTKVVYRKEQFNLKGFRLPGELIVRDCRYTISGISEICRATGFEVLEVKPTRAGNWNDVALSEDDDAAKELLVVAQKIRSVDQ